MIALGNAQGENLKHPEPCKGSLTLMFSLINLSLQDRIHGFYYSQHDVPGYHNLSLQDIFEIANKVSF